jgi:WD40 repeat protein
MSCSRSAISSPDGGFVLTGCVDGTAKRWSCDSEESLKTLQSTPVVLFGYVLLVPGCLVCCVSGVLGEGHRRGLIFPTLFDLTANFWP